LVDFSHHQKSNSRLRSALASSATASPAKRPSPEGSSGAGVAHQWVVLWSEGRRLLLDFISGICRAILAALLASKLAFVSVASSRSLKQDQF